MYGYDWSTIFEVIKEAVKEDFNQSLRNPLFWILFPMLAYLVWDMYSNGYFK